MIPNPRANWIKVGAGDATEEAHQTRIFFGGWLSMAFFYLPLHHTTCIFSLLVHHGGPAAHLLGGPTYRNQHSIFHQAPKTTQYYVCFEAENITTGVERGRGKTQQKY